MEIPLQEFEQHIDEQILSRGWSYFHEGYVTDVEQVSPDQYQAVVSGSEDYLVHIQLQKGHIVEHVCNCPYDYGPVCKHVVAVIFHIQQDVMNLTKTVSRKKKPKKGKQVTTEADELISRLSMDELKAFIHAQVKENAWLRQSLFSAFPHHHSNESQSFYARQIRDVLKAETDRQGFIHRQAALRVGKVAADLLNSAQKLAETKNQRSAIFICCAVMEEMTQALQFADDSNGVFGNTIEHGYSLLLELNDEKLSEQDKKLLFDYALDAHQKGIYSGWDWHSGMLTLALHSFSNENEAEQIIEYLDKYQSSEYEREQAELIRLLILEKIRSQEDVEQYINQTIANPYIRRIAIEKALIQKDYSKAKSIANDGIRLDANSKPGLVTNWNEWLLKIAKAQENRAEIIQYARLLFVTSHREKQQYYQLLKSNVEPDEWNLFVEGLIRDIWSGGRWESTQVIANIYIEEKWWDRLFELVKDVSSLEFTKKCEKYLTLGYSDELIDLYESCIKEHLKDHVGRGHYQFACRYIRRMIKLGGQSKAKELIAQTKSQYPQRRALLDELDRV